MKNPCKGCEDRYRSCEDYCPKIKEIRAKKHEQKVSKNEAQRGEKTNRS